MIFFNAFKDEFARNDDQQSRRRFGLYWHERMLHEGRGKCLYVIDLKKGGWANLGYHQSRLLFEVFDYYYPNQIKSILILNLSELFKLLFTFLKQIAGTKASKIAAVTKSKLMTYLAKDQQLMSFNVTEM